MATTFRIGMQASAAKLKAFKSEMSGISVQVGFPGKGDARKLYADGTPVAYVAAIQEYGAPDAKIPPRPFIRPTIYEKSKEWEEIMQGLCGMVARGELSGFDALDNLGRAAAADIKVTIAGITEPKLSPITVMLRKIKWDEKRKVTGRVVGEAARRVAAGEDPGSYTKPLNDTGYLIQSVGHAVVNKGAK